jgi:hypothetical protein
MEIKNTKKCTKCGVEKELSEFAKNKNTKDGVKPACKVCVNKQTAEKYRNNPILLEKKNQEARERYKEKTKFTGDIDNTKVKVCNKCGCEKILDKYTKNIAYVDGVENTCKDCKNNDKRDKVKNDSEYREKINQRTRDRYNQRAIENANKQQDLNLIFKVCSKCGIEKDGTCFNKHKSRQDGLTGVCKECRNKYLSDKGKENPEYRITLNEKRLDRINIKKETFKNVDNTKLKVCSKCGTEKTLDKFVKDILCTDGTKNICCECKNKQSKEILNNNPERRVKYNRQRREKINHNEEYRKEIRKKQSEFLKNNPEIKEKYKQQQKDKLKEPEYRDRYNKQQRKYRLSPNSKKSRKIREARPEHRIAKSMRRSIKRVLNYSDMNYVNEKLGYTKHELMSHLEKQFNENMSWENYGTWHVDHIIPITKFDKSTPIYVINHLENLQPLDGFENKSKNNRIELIPERTIGKYVLFLNKSGKYQL